MATMMERGPFAASERERQTVRQLEEALQQLQQGNVERAEMGAQALTLLGPQGERVALPDSVATVLRQVVHALANGQAVAVVPVTTTLTTQAAADLLTISRPSLIALLEGGVIPFTKVGTHRRIQFEDLMAYKRQRDQEREHALDQLAQLNQELGLYDA